MCNEDEDDDFHGYELLSLRKLQTDRDVCMEWRGKLYNKHVDDDFHIGEIPHNLWFLAVTLDKKKKRFLKFVFDQLRQANQGLLRMSRETLLGMYLNKHQFSELHLDGIFKYGDDNTLPAEIFSCPNVKKLSMKYNYLDRIPPTIGQMSQLEYLSLTNNKLQNKSIPMTLIFCTKLKHLLLDNNLLDALPGFLMRMKSLETVHRHGNHNYFKSTFMWYHTDVNERILSVGSMQDFVPREPESLQFYAAKAIIGAKKDFYADPGISVVLKDYLSDIYNLFNICEYCDKATLSNNQGYKVITFKNPYLGNTCVPFQHWACSIECSTSIEIPAREEQIRAACILDRKYDAYIKSCENEFDVGLSPSGRLRRQFRLPPRPRNNVTCSCEIL